MQNEVKNSQQSVKKPRGRGPGRPFQKGQSANPHGRPKQDATPPQLPDTSYKYSREEWARIEKSLKREIAKEAKRGLESSHSRIHALSQSASIAHQNAYKRQSEETPALVTPQIIVDRLIALAVKQAASPAPPAPPQEKESGEEETGGTG